MAQPIWNTAAGSLGGYTAGLTVTVQLSASPVLPATSVTYTLISGSLPVGLTISTSGLINGIPTLVTTDTTSTFTIRATDNLNNLRDRTFSMLVSGSANPQFTTPEGNILNTLDSQWVEIPIEFDNPVPTNAVVVELSEGLLPPGLEINEQGVIRGYPQPPTVTVTLSSISTNVTTTTSGTNILTCSSTIQFTPGRPIVFSGTVFGNIVDGVTYYVKSVVSPTEFTITTTQDGNVLALSNSSGLMTATLTAVSVGQPTVRTYSFALKLYSDLGNDIASYSITVINQNTPVSQGGPGYPVNTRVPTILNTRPLTFNLNDNDPYYGYYRLPPVDPSVPAQIGTIESDNYFSFKIIGYDFDGNDLRYSFSNLPPDLVGDTVTGWITGTPTLNVDVLNNYNFNVRVYKSGTPSITTPNFNFSLSVSKNITGVIIWNTDTNLGTIYNGSVSTLYVNAVSDVPLNYSLSEGSLPPNLTLNSNGELVGVVADQPTDQILNVGDTTEYSFTITAYSPNYPTISSSKSFVVTVVQEFDQPTDTLYITCTPGIDDRNLINSLLNDETIIPSELVYRPTDINFGKSTNVVYEHAYGIYASMIDEYIAAVTRNHYWRYLTLGEIKTAVAKNDAGEIVYEVVYSEIIDNLENPQGTSISNPIIWPRPIDLGLGPWYTSITDIYTSYDKDLPPGFYTSRTPGYARTLYPNSLYNMRNRVADVLGQEYNSKLLPLWMTSQQANGGTLGFTKAWVICYTKPGFSETIKNNINNNWPYTLNLINFRIDRFTVNKSITYNYDNLLAPPTWTGLPSGTPVPDPIDSKDFYVLFPRQTILPDEPQ